jgi:histidine kinase/DNA gyrase B/HSP90-like ATPase/phospho-acceptor domain-containing protein
VTQGANVESEPRSSRPTPAATPTSDAKPRTTDAFAAIGSPAVAAAAERVLATWTNDLGEAINLAEVRDALAWLAAMVDRAASSEPVGEPGPVATVLGRHLLGLLRADLVRNWASSLPGRAESLLDILRAVEDVHDAIDPDWSQYFSSRLSGPDGLDLVVEVAHDLRSPVTSILFLAETLGRAQSGEVNELQRRQLRLIYSAALGLSSMASDVIELARGGDQVVERDLSPFSVSEVVESVLDMVRPIAEEKGLELRFTPLTSDHRQGRPLVLSRVLLNLTTNALKFTDEGYVEITARAHGLTRVEFSVRDTGHGISEEALASLFQPFRRTRARAGRSGYYFSGTGLGLAMCRKLVEAVGADLRFETKAGGGTRFYFEVDLPLAASIG